MVKIRSKNSATASADITGGNSARMVCSESIVDTQIRPANID